MQTEVLGLSILQRCSVAALGVADSRKFEQPERKRRDLRVVCRIRAPDNTAADSSEASPTPFGRRRIFRIALGCRCDQAWRRSRRTALLPSSL